MKGEGNRPAHGQKAMQRGCPADLCTRCFGVAAAHLDIGDSRVARVKGLLHADPDRGLGGAEGRVQSGLPGL